MDLMPELAALEEPSLCIHSIDLRKSRQYNDYFNPSIRLEGPCSKCGAKLIYERHKYDNRPTLVMVQSP